MNTATWDLPYWPDREKVSGQTLEVYTREKIFKPLGMTHTQWEYSKVQPAQLAKGYRMVDKALVEEPILHHGTYGAMGGLITSIDDFHRYVSLHMSAWPSRDDAESPVLKRSSLREMHMPANFSGFDPAYKYPSGRVCGVVSAYVYGLNWMRDCENRIYVGHSGGLPGFGSQWRFLPDYGIGVISFANLPMPGDKYQPSVLDTLIRRAKLHPGWCLHPRYWLPENQLMQLLPDWNEAVLRPLPQVPGRSLQKTFFLTIPWKLCGPTIRLCSKRWVSSLRLKNGNGKSIEGKFILRGEKQNCVFSLP